MLFRAHKRLTVWQQRQLAGAMALIAGAVNAGGFLAISHYTSHMTGVVSGMADALVLSDWEQAVSLAAMMAWFLAGAFSNTWLVLFAQRRRLQGGFAWALLVEAHLLLLFGLLGPQLAKPEPLFLPLTASLLCFIMGMHNACVTKMSGAIVRTTHVTGVVTDLGIELARAAYFNRSRCARLGQVRANRDKLALHGIIVGAFFSGGVIGALAFKGWGYSATLPLALALLLLAWRPVAYDVHCRWRWRRRYHRPARPAVALP